MGALAGGLAVGGPSGTAAVGDHGRQTQNFEYVEDDANDYYVRTDWLEGHGDRPAADAVPPVLTMDGYVGAGAYDPREAGDLTPPGREPPRRRGAA